MLNKRPIFIVGFDHGGTNILLNLLRSHPNVCSPRGELTEVFQGKGRPPKIRESLREYLLKWWRYNIPVLFWQREMVFSKRLWRIRRPFTSKTIAHVDRALYQDKLRARSANQNRYKTESVEYTLDEIRASRLLSKNVAGLIFLTDELVKMYPDAVFIAIVRNGLALSEGHIRRGVNPQTVAQRYHLGCKKILKDYQNLPNYHIIRFEDILERPYESLQQVYDYSDLDIGDVKKVRLESKRVIGEDGDHHLVHKAREKEMIWYGADSFADHFILNVNENQIARLTIKQKDIIRNIAGDMMQQFGYG